MGPTGLDYLQPAVRCGTRIVFQAIEYVRGKRHRLVRPPFLRCVVFNPEPERNERVRSGSPS
jgi:hypothetical protein